MSSPRMWIPGCKLCLVFSLLLTLSACGGGRFQTLQLRDTTFLGSAHVSKGLYRADRSLDPADVQTELGVEGGFFRGSGSQPTLVFAETLVGSQTFTPPQTIDTDFAFTSGDASLHWRHALIKRRIGYDLSGGFGWSDLNFEASSPAGQGKDSISSPTFRLSVGAFGRVIGGTSLEAEATALGGNSNFTGQKGYRLSLVQKLGRNVTVSGGYSSWNVETSNSTRSRIDLTLAGLAAGINVRF